MKVSVVIPVYNVAPYIVRCLESVSGQSGVDMEVILVDDCGTDESVALAREYVATHDFPECRIIAHERNRGLSAARNTGLSAATGEYVYFLDSDDEMVPDSLKSAVAPLSECRYDFVISDYGTVGSDREYPSLSLPEGAVLGNAGILHSYAEGKWYMMAWNKLCRRQFLLDNDLFFEEGLLHEDVIWSFRLACRAATMYVNRKYVYRYHVRESSIMTAMTIRHDVDAYLKAFRAMTDFVVSDGRAFGHDEYEILEGRKNTLLLSLLEKGETELHREAYRVIRQMRRISPFSALSHHVTGFSHFVRDFHYCLTLEPGRAFNRAYYLVFYRLAHRKVQGALL